MAEDVHEQVSGDCRWPGTVVTLRFSEHRGEPGHRAGLDDDVQKPRRGHRNDQFATPDGLTCGALGRGVKGGLVDETQHHEDKSHPDVPRSGVA